MKDSANEPTISEMIHEVGGGPATEVAQRIEARFGRDARARFEVANDGIIFMNLRRSPDPSDRARRFQQWEFDRVQADVVAAHRKRPGRRPGTGFDVHLACLHDHHGMKYADAAAQLRSEGMMLRDDMTAKELIDAASRGRKRHAKGFCPRCNS